ncbi:MAG: bifunctional pyr operon transcriptional regulator/uracil phosphoribosyltransferase PyrR [Flavobacteriales bacterium]
MGTEPVRILGKEQFALTIDRLCYQVVEAYERPDDLVLLGIQPRGAYLSQRLMKGLDRILEKSRINAGELDITFFRDDIRKRDEPPVPNATSIEGSLDDKDVILVDDVLYTGRTIRAALDAMLAYGRPRSVELLVLVDRRFSRHLPIQPDMTGITVDTVDQERVKVSWTQDGEPEEVLLYSPEQEKE